MSIEKGSKIEGSSRDQERRENIESVSDKSSPELIERRIQELFPLMMGRTKLNGVVRGLNNLMNNPDAGLEQFRQAPGDVAPEVQGLLRQSQFLRTAGLSEKEIMMTPFWREGLEEARAKLSERLAKVNDQFQKFAMHTDMSIGRALESAVDLKIGLDSIREASASEEDYKAIIEDILNSHREKSAA